MKKKKIRYIGNIDHFLTDEIYLNVNNLNEGKYTLKIVHKSKVIKQTKFTKN